MKLPQKKRETPPEAVRSHTGSNPAPRLFSPTWPGRVAASLKKNFIIATRGPVAADRPTREPVQSVRRWEFSRAPLGFRHSCVQTNKTGLNQMDLRKRKSYSFSVEPKGKWKPKTGLNNIVSLAKPSPLRAAGLYVWRTLMLCKPLVSQRSGCKMLGTRCVALKEGQSKPHFVLNFLCGPAPWVPIRGSRRKPRKTGEETGKSRLDGVGHWNMHLASQ